MNLQKRGQISMEVVVFLILNILAFSIGFFFIGDALDGVAFYERAYAKELAFLIDTARPGTDISLDFSKGLKIASEQGVRGEALDNLVIINNETGEIIVWLGGKGSKSFRHFSDYHLVGYFQEESYIIKVRDLEVLENE